jgi:hypothetical protein
MSHTLVTLVAFGSLRACKRKGHVSMLVLNVCHSVDVFVHKRCISQLPKISFHVIARYEQGGFLVAVLAMKKQQIQGRQNVQRRVAVHLSSIIPCAPAAPAGPGGPGGPGLGVLGGGVGVVGGLGLGRVTGRVCETVGG